MDTNLISSSAAVEFHRMFYRRLVNAYVRKTGMLRCQLFLLIYLLFGRRSPPKDRNSSLSIASIFTDGTIEIEFRRRHRWQQQWQSLRTHECNSSLDCALRYSMGFAFALHIMRGAIRFHIIVQRERNTHNSPHGVNIVFTHSKTLMKSILHS